MTARSIKFGTAVLATTLALGCSAFAATPYLQDGTKQDMKSAGHETKDAAADAGHGVKTGTKKAYHKTKHGVKKAYHKTAHTLDPHANSQDENHQ